MMLPGTRKRLRTYFLTGLVVLLPAIISVKVFLWLLTFVDNLLKPMLEGILGRYFFGIGICVSVFIVLAVGVFAQNYLGKRIVRLVEAIFDRLPFIRTIYSVVRQLIEPFSSESGNAFGQAVMIEYPMNGRFAIGFLANEHVGRLGSERLVTVFLPTNHLHLGYLVVMRGSEVTPLDLSLEDALKIMVSCGIVVPTTLNIGDVRQVADQTGQDGPRDIADVST